jgi:hypothetical protein
MEAIMRRLLLSLAMALSLCAVGASSALAEAQKGAQKAPLYGPNDGYYCYLGGFPTATTHGFVVFNTPDSRATLSGEVALKGAPPNATYQVVVVQYSSCLGTTFTLTTNKQGNGNLHFTTERFPGSTGFFVDLNRSFEEFNSPIVELD